MKDGQNIKTVSINIVISALEHGEFFQTNGSSPSIVASDDWVRSRNHFGILSQSTPWRIQYTFPFSCSEFWYSVENLRTTSQYQVGSNLQCAFVIELCLFQYSDDQSMWPREQHSRSFFTQSESVEISTNRNDQNARAIYVLRLEWIHQ